MATYAKVRRMRLREGLSISEIARRTSLSRNTLKTWLGASARDAMRYQRPAGPKKITTPARPGCTRPSRRTRGGPGASGGRPSALRAAAGGASWPPVRRATY